MANGTKRQRKAARSSAKTHSRRDAFREDNIDDEIDSFHKQPDIIPLDVNNKLGESEEEDLEEPIFDIEIPIT